MKKLNRAVSVLLIGVCLFFTSPRIGAQTEKTSLPNSLDTLYPPKASQPVYLFRMYGMATPFSGMVADLMENDMGNVIANYEKFKTLYFEVSKLVPEWTNKFPAGPVNDLGTALKFADPGKVMTAFEKVARSCDDCHKTYMPLAQFKFHWNDFKSVTIQDPLTKEVVSFSRLMQFMETNLTGIAIDIEQGQKENAQKQFQGFCSRFQAMKETCMNCHDTERTYYIDENVQNMINQLGQVLDAPSVDSKEAEKFRMAILKESCTKCHLVHVPAAYVKFQWTQ